jgi:hypothetical protein
MAIVEVIVPQLGEGLQEVRVMRFLKQPGERVARDEHIYEMETDKANVEVESPYAGRACGVVSQRGRHLTDWRADCPYGGGRRGGGRCARRACARACRACAQPRGACA